MGPLLLDEPPAADSPEALASSVCALELGGAGSGWKLTWAVKDGSPLGHVPLEPPEPPPPPLLDLAELCRVTLLTPLTKRRRTSICATAICVVAHPASVNVGVVPGGVAEVTGAAEAAVEAVEAVEAADAVDAVEPVEPAEPAAGAAVLLLTVALPVEEPIVPCSELSEIVRGSTRLSSLIVADQSKRDPISWEMACRRCSRICMKLV